MMHNARRFLGLLVFSLMVACGQQVQPVEQTSSAQITPNQPLATATVSATDTTQPEPTAVPNTLSTETATATMVTETAVADVSPTPKPTRTPIVTPSNTPSPTATPSPELVGMVLETPTAVQFVTPEPFTYLPPELSSLQIAVATEQRLWYWRNGVATPLVETGQPVRLSLSPDGAMIAYILNDELWAVNTDGSNQRLLVPAATVTSLAPEGTSVYLYLYDWIPGTHSILFNTALRSEVGLALTDDLHVVNADTGEWHTILPAREGGRFAIAPNGQSVAVISPASIRLMNIDGSNAQTVLSYPEISTYGEYKYYPEPIWAEDSTFLLVDIPSQEWMENPDAVVQIWRIPSDATSNTLIAEIHAEARNVSISPDQTRISYRKRGFFSDPGLAEFHIANIDGSNDTIYYVDGSIAQWTPDSTHFVAYIQEGNGGMKQFLGEVGQTTLLPLSDSKYIGVQWINETYYFFRNANDQLSIGSVDGTGFVLIGLGEGQFVYDVIQ